MKRRLVTMTIQTVLRDNDPDFREDHDEQRTHLQMRWKETVTKDEPSKDAELSSFVVDGLEDL